MTRLVLLGGFLGAGKTTTMLAAARVLEDHGRRVAVITNDQGEDLVDSARVNAAGLAAAEVTGGCFCCRFDDLAGVVEHILAARSADTILAEAVGSCTDLQATVVRPLRRRRGLTVAPLTTVVDPGRLITAMADDMADELAYLFDRQLAEADVIALNKTDLLDVAARAALVSELRDRYQNAAVHGFSASTGAGLPELVAAWDRRPPAERDIDVDYDRYASAEAALAWLNQRWEVRPASGHTAFSPTGWVSAVLTSITEHCGRLGFEMGHAKVFAGTPSGHVAMSVVTAGAAPVPSAGVSGTVDRASVSVNIRAVCSPDELSELVVRSVAAADRAAGAISQPEPASAFRPVYPRPVHRVPAQT